MSKFEIYMINTIKEWSDREQKEKDKDIRWMEKNVLYELMNALCTYRNYLNDDDEKEDEVTVAC